MKWNSFWSNIWIHEYPSFMSTFLPHVVIVPARSSSSNQLDTLQLPTSYSVIVVQFSSNKMNEWHYHIDSSLLGDVLASVDISVDTLDKSQIQEELKIAMFYIRWIIVAVVVHHPQPQQLHIKTMKTNPFVTLLLTMTMMMTMPLSNNSSRKNIA